MSTFKENLVVRVSTTTYSKVTQLEKYLRYSGATQAWGKDQKLLHCNLLLVPSNRNYIVLLSMGRNNANKRN